MHKSSRCGSNPERSWLDLRGSDTVVASDRAIESELTRREVCLSQTSELVLLLRVIVKLALRLVDSSSTLGMSAMGWATSMLGARFASREWTVWVGVGKIPVTSDAKYCVCLTRPNDWIGSDRPQTRG
eukprot:1080947-Rhodomonas_salina.1